MIRYQIRSISLLNIVNDVRSRRLVQNPYFQRNLVWREIHKRDFIDTILNGYPFPQLFFSRGRIDLDLMQATSCIVDGQQRTNAILEFVDNKIAVNGKYFRDIDDAQKAEFFKYEVGVIELDLDNDSPEIKEIFKRLNRTSNSLTTIEKLASEYGASEYMLVAKLLTDQLELPEDAQEDELRVDPAISSDFFEWARDVNAASFHKLLREANVFTDHEIARKVPLFHVLNMMSTVIGGNFNRNDLSLQLLEDHKETFPDKQKIIDAFIQAAEVIRALKLSSSSIWFKKASFFTLCIEIASRLYQGDKIDIQRSRDALEKFASAPDEDFSLAAREGVNNKRERSLRAEVVNRLLVSESKNHVV